MIEKCILCPAITVFCSILQFIINGLFVNSFRDCDNVYTVTCPHYKQQGNISSNASAFEFIEKSNVSKVLHLYLYFDSTLIVYFLIKLNMLT